MSSGLDELERRGRWGRTDPPAPPQPDPPAPRQPDPPGPPGPAQPSPKTRSMPRQPRRRASKPAPATSAGGVERVVIYLSPAQTAWIRERQIEALRAGKRVTTSKLIRELMDRAME
jgi:hypothetical protein